jgi:hypothetical protein
VISALSAPTSFTRMHPKGTSVSGVWATFRRELWKTGDGWQTEFSGR